MSRKILVTGGAGFIGSFLVEKLLAQHWQVTVADNFSTGSRANLGAVSGDPDLRIVECDLTTDAEIAESLVRESEVVIHLAAAVGVNLVVESPEHAIFTNIRGTENILLPASRYHRRLIIASTSEVYGKSDREFFAESDDLRLGSPYHSRWCYACSKLLDEFLLMAHCRNAELPGTVVRFFNTVGPRQTGRYGMVLPRFVQAALAGKSLCVYGDGGQSRCFCHVRDVVRALIGLIDRPESIGNIYNIGSQELVTIKELALRVIERCHSNSKMEFIPYDQAYAQGFEDMRRRRPDISKISALLGWKPEADLDQIIDDIRDFESQRPESR